jgi:hypothetical protein
MRSLHSQWQKDLRHNHDVPPDVVIRKPLELPPTVARAFVKDMRALLRRGESEMKGIIG